MPNISSQRSKGFTLIEVMVALTIIAIALASVIKASGNHTNSAGYLKSKQLAHYVAMNEIALLQINKAWPDVGSVEKSSELAGMEWFWTREIENTGDRGSNIRGVKFIVYSDERRERNLAQVQAFISNPAQNITAAMPNNNPQNGQPNATPGTGAGGTPGATPGARP